MIRLKRPNVNEDDQRWLRRCKRCFALNTLEYIRKHGHCCMCCGDGDKYEKFEAFGIPPEGTIGISKGICCAKHHDDRTIFWWFFKRKLKRWWREFLRGGSEDD